MKHSIEICNITLGYNPEKIILSNASAVIPAGSVTYILGGSGCGKSTLMQSIIGLLEPQEGSIIIGGEDVYSIPAQKLYSKVGVVFQSGALLEDVTIFENISLVLKENTGYNDKEIEECISKVLYDVHLTGVEDRYPSELSGGMRKRVALARAIVLEKSIIVCDEPTSGLDPIVAGQIDLLFHSIQEKNPTMTICIISHDIRSAMMYATHIVLLHNNTIYFEGTPEELEQSKDVYIELFVNAGTARA